VRETAGGLVAIVVGNEGGGLDVASMAACDLHARVPMAPGADSLNVATALAVALYAWQARR
jgi:tRNA G18 (ribose-2'-O)-methylase SpoU